MVGAGLVARNAVNRGMTTRPWVKTSLAPGSKVVTSYLETAGLQDDLNALGFNLVGYGCTTCIGNTGPLPAPIGQAIADGDLVACAVLSGNRNFEARIHADIKGNYLASPPLVVAYALAGRMDIDITTEPLGQDSDGNDVYLADLWPSPAEIQETVASCLRVEMFESNYADVFSGRRAVERARDPDRRVVRMAGRLHLRSASSLLRRHGGGARFGRGHLGRTLPGEARRQRHDRPHLSGGGDQAGEPGRPVPD